MLGQLKDESTQQCQLIAENIVAMLRQAQRAGVTVDDSESLKQEIAEIVVGKTGYVYVLGGSGEHKGHYVVSKDRTRDGETVHS